MIALVFMVTTTEATTTARTTGRQQMEELLTSHEALLKIPVVGDIVTGTVLDKGRNALYVDLGHLGVGVIYGRELLDDVDTYRRVKVSDTLQATVQRVENEEGYVELSLRSASRERSWEELRRKLDEGDIFLTEIIEANKGGLIVRASGVTGFLPVSQLAPDHYPRVEGGDKAQILERLKGYVGKQFKVKVITAQQDEEKLIVSEKAAIGDEISEILGTLGGDRVIEGTVSGVVDFGVFVKFVEAGTELEGLVHISELAWQRIDNPADLYTVGDHVKAKVIGVDGLRISLSIKQLQADPWLKVHEKYSIGDTVKGEILKVTPFGGFIKLDDDIHALIHVSELPDEAQVDPAQMLKVGTTMDFYIISMEPTEHRLGLSLTKGGRKAEAQSEAAPASKAKSKKAAKAEPDAPAAKASLR